LLEIAKSRHPMPPPAPVEYLSITPKWAEARHKKAMRVFLQERMLAAEYALAHLCDAFVKDRGARGIQLREDGEPLGRLTAQNFGAWALRRQRELACRPDNPDKGYPKSFQQRAWRNTKPVLHLATAYLCCVRGDQGRASINTLFNNQEQAADLIEGSELCRQRLLELAAAGNFELREEETILVTMGIKNIPAA
jgi:hypothetical protein